MSMLCRECGMQAMYGDKLCRSCGGVVINKPSKQFCKNCGVALYNETKFCDSCGAVREGAGGAIPTGGISEQSYPIMPTPPIVPVQPMPPQTVVQRPVASSPVETPVATPSDYSVQQNQMWPSQTVNSATTAPLTTATQTVNPMQSNQLWPQQTVGNGPSGVQFSPTFHDQNSSVLNGGKKSRKRPAIIAAAIVGAAIILVGIGFLMASMFSPDDVGDETSGYESMAEATPEPIPEEIEEPTPQPPEQELSENLAVLTGAEVFERNRDAVIIIRTYYGDGIVGTGSGFFVCQSGIAITNHHVMNGAIDAVAILYDGREFEITGYYSYDFDNDLAVIHVDGRGYAFDYTNLGDSDAIRVGEDVFAIGGPEWDPITITSGMISRIVYEPLSVDAYSIAGLIQSTAATYGGNSGGPLLNDRGEVIGVNVMGHTVRASVQFAVPVNRVVVPAGGAGVSSLPIDSEFSFIPQTPDELYYYTRYPFIPMFLSASPYGSFIFSGTPSNLGLFRGDVIYDFYDYIYAYTLLEREWVDATDAFDDALIESGFILQNAKDFDTEFWMYFYHPIHNVSLSYGFVFEEEALIIAVTEGDVYEALYHDGDINGGGGSDTGQISEGDTSLFYGEWHMYLLDMGIVDTPFYIFEPNGRGTRNGYDIRWWVADGIFFMCSTPDSCPSTSCIAPQRWYYEINGETLIFTSPDFGLDFEFVRVSS